MPDKDTLKPHDCAQTVTKFVITHIFLNVIKMWNGYQQNTDL